MPKCYQKLIVVVGNSVTCYRRRSDIQSTDKFDISGFEFLTCHLVVHIIEFKVVSFLFNINICGFCVAIPISVAIEAPPSGENHFIRKPDPNFRLLAC